MLNNIRLLFSKKELEAKSPLIEIPGGKFEDGYYGEIRVKKDKPGYILQLIVNDDKTDETVTSVEFDQCLPINLEWTYVNLADLFEILESSDPNECPFETEILEAIVATTAKFVIDLGTNSDHKLICSIPRYDYEGEAPIPSHFIINKKPSLVEEE